MEYYSSSKEEVINLLKSSPEGLTEKEAQSRLEKYGQNKLKEKKELSSVKIFIRQFHDPLIYILIAATIISFIVKENIDAYVILTILILNAVFGFIQEYKAEKSIQLLKKLTSLKSNVIRQGKIKEIFSTEIVPGDILIIEEGTKIPADLRILESYNLHVNEASLTGESNPVTKNLEIINKVVQIADQTNMLFSGTTVTSGRGKAIATKTGMETELGKIATLVTKVKPVKTPLQKRLTEFSKWLGIATLAICAVIFVIGLVRGIDIIEILLTAISLAVAAVPEGLPAVVTISLAISVRRMIKRKSLIKRLKAVETLGSITVICSDKTGTLTKNEMTATKLYVNKKIIDVTGTGYNVEGNFLYQNKKIDPKELKLALEISISCNNATENYGDPTELALFYAAKKANISRTERKDEIPFDSDKKFMATIHEGFSYYKGAPEVILKKCTHIINKNIIKKITKQDIQEILKINENLAEQALRVLALAYKKNNKFIFVGLAGMIDPPRKEVKHALNLCKTAGIRSIMITGDHPITAKAIAQQIGFDNNLKIITGSDLDKLNDKELKEAVKDTSIYARTTSTHKLRILSAIQSNHEIVAMTGDGINDAPAIKKADVGVAMAIKGTDVTRDTADMVLTDDNFSSIVNAVEEGRIVYDNIKKFIKFLLGANLAEVLTILIALILKFPLPLIAIQLLWLNLITDSLPALALGVTPPEQNVMTRPPRKPKESFFKDIKIFIILAGILGTIITLTPFFIYLKTGLESARTIALTALVISELIFVFSCQSSLPFNKLFRNKWLVIAVISALVMHLLVIYTPLNIFFHLTPIPLAIWIFIILISSSMFFIMEIRKFFVTE